MRGKLIFILSLCCFLLCSCGKSEAVRAAEDAITAIGDVTSDSGNAIANAEKLYGILTDSEKSEVDNRLTLVEARESYDDLQAEAIYDNAKEAYDKLNEIANICIDGMDDIYGGWYFGIYEASDSYATSIFSDLAAETPHLTSQELEDAADAFGFSGSALKSDWQNILYIVEYAIAKNGDYDTVKDELEEASAILQELTTTYDDYTYYPKLKDYYSAVSSYADFFLAPTGSFKQLSDTINQYETNIRTYQSDVGFLFH